MSGGPAPRGAARHDLAALWLAYRMRLRRRRLLARAVLRRGQLTPLANRTARIAPDDILCFATVRNEAVRLPFFLDHHRRLGVAQFLVVDNGSDDGTRTFLADQPDVSLWGTDHSYREARFGMDWLTWLQMRHGHGHWCLTLDADEALIYPHHDTRPLPRLTEWLDAQGVPMMAALMLDLFPRGPLSAARCAPGEDPARALPWFDAEGHTWDFQPRYRNISIRGGPRRRVFFADSPDHAPHLHKTPLIRWHRSYAYVSSTHIALPRRLNAGLDARRAMPTGVLLHSKFLDLVIDKSREEKTRRQHFTHPGRYDGYYDRLIADPDLWHPGAERFRDWQQLEDLGLMTCGNWS